MPTRTPKSPAKPTPTGTVNCIQGGTIETIAHAIHNRWRAEQLDAGRSAPSWPELDESRKESSRAQARDITVKLRRIGCAVAPLDDGNATAFRFTPEEVELLATDEHDRWSDERRSAGWTLGDKDVETKKTPYLVPFAELPADIAEYDRMFVREIPALLASAGLRVVRRSSTARETLK